MKWLLLAESSGEEVTELKSRIQAEMTPEQMAEAQRRAEEFRQSHTGNEN